MFFHVPTFLYSIFFVFIAELASADFISELFSSFSTGRFVLESLFFIAMLAYFFQVAHKISRKASMTPIPVLFVLSSIGLLYFANSTKQQQTLILLSGILYYFIHLALYRMRACSTDQTAHGLVAAGGISTIFLFYSTAYGIYLNFNIPLAMFMLAIMLVTALVSFQYLGVINKDEKNVLSYSLILGLVMAEIVWVLNFWPFGYLTTGVITLIFYYVFWDLVQCHFLNELSKRRVVANLVFFGVLVALVLSSTKWLPVV